MMTDCLDFNTACIFPYTAFENVEAHLGYT